MSGRKGTAITIQTLRSKLAENAGTLSEYLGKTADVDHYCAGIVEEFEKNPALYTCEPKSIFQAVRKLALTGLQPGLPAGQEEAYFVPYGNACQLLISYRGLIELARRSGSVKRVVARTVHKGKDRDLEDYLEFDDGLRPHMNHRKMARQRTWETMTHVYAHFLLDDGLEHLEVMTKDEVEQHKKRYVKATGKDSPWQTDPLAMARKTVIRRAFTGGQIPLSQQVRQIVAADDVNQVTIHSEIIDESGPDGAVIDAIEETGMDSAHQPKPSPEQRELQLKGELDT